MSLREMVAEARTIAEQLGLTTELGETIVALAGSDIGARDLGAARDMIEGLVVVNPRDPVAWALLSAILRRQGEAEASRFSAEVAARLAPDDVRVRLVRAEALLASPPDRARGLLELRSLAGDTGPVAERAQALLVAAGN